MVFTQVVVVIVVWWEWCHCGCLHIPIWEMEEIMASWAPVLINTLHIPKIDHPKPVIWENRPQSSPKTKLNKKVHNTCSLHHQYHHQYDYHRHHHWNILFWASSASSSTIHTINYHHPIPSQIWSSPCVVVVIPGGWWWGAEVVQEGSSVFEWRIWWWSCTMLGKALRRKLKISLHRPWPCTSPSPPKHKQLSLPPHLDTAIDQQNKYQIAVEYHHQHCHYLCNHFTITITTSLINQSAHTWGDAVWSVAIGPARPQLHSKKWRQKYASVAFRAWWCAPSEQQRRGSSDGLIRHTRREYVQMLLRWTSLLRSI